MSNGVFIFLSALPLDLFLKLMLENNRRSSIVVKGYIDAQVVELVYTHG